MDDQARRFREAARHSQGARTGRGIRYSSELHEQAVACARVRLRGGSSLLAVARDLGLRPQTLARWLEEKGRKSRLRPVEITAHGPTSQRGAPVLVTPGGLRIEGLDLESLAVLLRRLG
jgi:hypothetical protein